MAEHVARKSTLEETKNIEIQNVTDNNSMWKSELFKKWKSFIYVEQCDTPERILAYQDAIKLFLFCAAGKINLNATREEQLKQMVRIVCETEHQQELQQKK